jgi:predicted PurR-regulated permease PerM
VIDRMTPRARTITLVLVFVLVAWFMWSVRSVLNPLILAYLLAFVAHPLVLKLERRGWQRRRAVNVIFASFALLMVLIGAGIFFQGRGLARELSSEDGLGLKVRERLEQAIEQYHDEISWMIQLLPRRGEEKKGETQAHIATPTEAKSSSSAPPGTPESNEDRAAELKRELREWWSSWFTEKNGAQAADLSAKVGGGALFLASQVFGSLFTIFTLLILLPIYTYFFLFELERIHRFIARYLPRRDRARLIRIGGQIGEVLANFFRGRLLVCVAKGTFLTVGLYACGVDYALLLGMGTGFISLVPFVGSAIGFVMALLVGMLEHSVLESIVRVGIVFGLAEMFENYVLIPKILGNSLGLHPIIVIFSLMAGAASLGMFGLLIALPLTATLVILGREFLLPTLAEMADKDPSR